MNASHTTSSQEASKHLKHKHKNACRVKDLDAGLHIPLLVVYDPSAGLLFISWKLWTAAFMIRAYGACEDAERALNARFNFLGNSFRV